MSSSTQDVAPDSGSAQISTGLPSSGNAGPPHPVAGQGSPPSNGGVPLNQVNQRNVSATDVQNSNNRSEQIIQSRIDRAAPMTAPNNSPGQRIQQPIAQNSNGQGSINKIQMNSSIQGMKPLNLPKPAGPQTGNIGQANMVNSVLGNLADEAFLSQLNQGETENLGTQNYSIEEDSQLLSPQSRVGDVRINQPNVNFGQPPRPHSHFTNNTNMRHQESAMDTRYSAEQDSYPSGRPVQNGNKIVPMPIKVPLIDPKKMPFGGIGVGSAAQNIKNDRQNIKALGQDEETPFGAQSDRRDGISLRSSYDYPDVDMNVAMKVTGHNTLTGRGKKFSKAKNFKEDNWLADDSIYLKQMKMPNVQTNNKLEYQEQIGINLDFGMNRTPRIDPEAKDDDSIQEARDMLAEPPFYKIIIKDRIQIIDDYHDRCPLLDLRKKIMRARVYCNRGAQMIMMHSTFETISISVIIVNSIFLAMDDPLMDPSETPQFMIVADDIFQYLYTIEMVVKIVSLGFILNTGSYLRDAWNILDFVIIASGYMGMFLQGSGVNLSALRSFRVIRPLRTISSVQGLRVIVSALINAIPLLRDSLLVLMFFFLVFAIAGCQLFTGALKNRCFNEETGVIDTEFTKHCGGGNMCRDGYYCAKSNENPANGATNFDNVMFALLQVFQVVSMEGWTSIMVALMQSVGTWIVVYFYPIIFIGAFFLLNLTLAVIKAKFTEEMNSKQENAPPPKKKKLDDAAPSSEDEDQKAVDLQKELERIKGSKNMSPRSKDNLINKLKVEYMIRRIDAAFVKQEVEHKIVERADEEEMVSRAPDRSQFAHKSIREKRKKLNAAEKIQILNPSMKAQMATQAATVKGVQQTIPGSLNYTEVFYSNKKTVLTLGGAHPGKELADIFVRGSKDLTGGATLTRAQNGEDEFDGTPIREDQDENQDMEALLYEERGQKRGIRSSRGHLTDIEGDRNAHNKSVTVSKWLGKVFEVGHGDTSVDLNASKGKKLIFAGMNQSKKQIPQPSAVSRSAKANAPVNEERQKQIIYDKITRNFDIFEFLEEENITASKAGDKKLAGAVGDEGDHELSDDLEFHIQNAGKRMESMAISQLNAKKADSAASQALPQATSGDRNIASRENNGMSQDDETRNGFLKRGITQMTQATATENGTKLLARSLIGTNQQQQQQQQSNADFEQKYVSPFMPSMRKSQQESIKKKKKYPKADIYPEINYRGNVKGIMNIFRACKQIQLRTGRDFKEEYIMIRKRARSIQNREHNPDDLMAGFNQEDNNNMTLADLSMYGTNGKADLNVTGKSTGGDVKQSVRAKSVENKRKHLLAASIKFQRRINLIKKRRAQYFAPAVKMIEVDLTEKDKEYEDYVLKKLKIKINPELIEESTLRKRVLYRSASAEAILRQRDYLNLRGSLGVFKRKHKLNQFDLLNMKHEEGGSLMDIETQRSVLIERDYERIVLNQDAKQVEINRYHEHEDVPPLEDIMQDKHLKIVVKMSNLRFHSINDVFEKSGAGRYMTAREKFLLEQEQKRKDALKLKLPVRIPPKDIILGYQKKIHYAKKTFHEDLLRNEFVPSDEDQDGMLGRIEDEFNYDHRSHVYNTGTISVAVNKPHSDNKILNANYHANIRAIERDEAWFDEMQEIENIKREKEAAHRKPGMVIIYNDDKVDHSAWKNSPPTYTLYPGNMYLRNASKFVLSRKIKASIQQSINEAPKGFDPIHPPPKPEPVNDKQILRYLNFECKKSRIFNQLNFVKLPDQIYKETELTAKFKIRGRKKKDEVEDDKDGSDGEELGIVRKMRKVDYFLDRKFEGLYHIDMARNSAFKRPRDTIEWSGQDVMSKFDPYKVRLAIAMLDVIRVWPYAFHGFVKKRRITLRNFMNGPFVEHGMTVCVLGNTVVLCLDYYGASQGVQDVCATANTFFTLVFAAEMFSRITAIGPSKWLADTMNYMDGTIVMLSLVEMIFMSGSGALSALRAVRIFRVFRVLRMMRLLRGLKSMLQIINVIQRSISSFIYLAMLLLLFVFIYALLGMQIFGGAFTDPEVVGTIRYNYDSFLNAFITSFIMLTTENWNTIMFYAFSGTTSQALIAVYFVSCIFVGNWMLLNLFLAILLDAFTKVEEEDMMTPEKKEMIKATMLLELKVKEGEDFIEGMDSLQIESFNFNTQKKNKKKKKKKPQKTNQSNNSSVNKSQEGDKLPAPGNILEESQEVDLNELAKRDEMKLAERKKLFRNIECENCIYLFSKKNWFRILCYKIVHHGKFETVIMFLIVGSSLKLVFDTYTDKLAPGDPIIKYSSYFDLTFQIAFTIEMLLKIFSFGFCMDENSYLTESWSQMDFFIVTTGLIDTSLEGVDIAFLKVLRLLRILRPLRFLSHSSSMKTLIEALMASIPSIMNVGVVIVIVFLMFAILGVNLFAGKLQYCSVNFYKTNTMEECFIARGTWETYVQNMDNVVVGMLTLFAVSNNEGWPDVMYAFCDATGVETGPKPGAGIINAFYFIAFVFVGSFFFLNLFTGVLFLNFEKAQRDEKDAMLLDGDEIKWVDMMKMICDEQPEIVKIPKNGVRRWFYDLVRDDAPFGNFIMGCIILNIFVMAANFEGQSDNYSNVLEKVNYFFTVAFTMECVSKLIAHGGNYFSSAWNKFDFFVVSASFLDIAMANMSANSLKVIRVGPQLARIMRVMRVSRLFKLLNKYKGLQALIQTITFSLPSVMNAFALLSLVYFIFSVLAVFFFKDTTKGLNLDSYMNFINFTQSMMFMLRLSTGEDWPMVMYDLMNTKEDCIPGVNCGTAWAPLFFIMFVLIQQYIMVDLFVLIILQQFDLYYLPDDNVLDRFKNDVTSFKITWKKFSTDFEGFKIRGNDINKFMKDLKGDLGMSAIKDKKTIERELVMMNIQADDDGFIYFNELLYKTMKRRYAYGRTKKKVLYELELDTLEKLEKIMTLQIFASRKKERQKAVSVNPFMAMMYKNMSFNVWREIYKQNLPKRIAHMQLGLDREISDEEEEEAEEEIQFEYVYETEEIEEIEETPGQIPAILEEQFDPNAMEFDDGLLPHERASKNYDQLRHEDEILGGGLSNRRGQSAHGRPGSNGRPTSSNRVNTQRNNAQGNTGRASAGRVSNQFASPNSKRGTQRT